MVIPEPEPNDEDVVLALVRNGQYSRISAEATVRINHVDAIRMRETLRQDRQSRR